MAEIYLKDLLDISERMATEVKRMRALAIHLPEGFIGENLEEKIKLANGFLSKFEMLKTFDELGITYFPNIASQNTYDFKILVKTEYREKVKKLAETSGYVLVDRHSAHHSNT